MDRIDAQPTPSTDAPAHVIRYFWLMTAQAPMDRGGFKTGTYDGTYDALPGDTTSAVFQVLRKHVADQMNESRISVLHFQLIPNELNERGAA